MSADHDELIRVAVRIWTAAEQLDAIHGGDTVWRWTHEQVGQLTDRGLGEHLPTLRRLADTLERRLEHDRGQRRQEA